MFDPRIYRSAFIPVALALVALAFSLTDQQGGLGTTLAPDAFNPQNAYSTLIGLSAAYPNRRPGSAGDDALASRVSQVFTRHGFAVSTSANPARTTDGTRTLEMVTATRTGFSSGQIVVVAPRDALTAPATADLSGTATLLELARVEDDHGIAEPVDLGSLARACASRPWAVPVVVEGDAVVLGRAALIASAIENLVANAAHFATEGPITIAITGARVTVANRGPALSRHACAHVFDRFYSTRASSGLGLAIVRSVALAHGGAAGVACADGTTTFWLTVG